MLQSEVNRAVAKVTGESVKTIAQLGFSIADPKVVPPSQETKPEVWQPRVRLSQWDVI